MNEQEKLNPKHSAALRFLRTTGPVLAVAGLICIVIAFVNFFSAVLGPSAGPPRLFWLFFVGMPPLAVGILMTKVGFAGKIARFFAAELAPVAKDTFNYMAEETQDGVKTVARAISAGIKEGTETPPSEANDPSKAAPLCSACGFTETADARFCSRCGRPLATR